MKNLTRSLTVAAIALVFALQPVGFAQAQTAASGTATAQDAGAQEKRDLYTKFYNAVTANKQDEAYQSAQEYVRKYPNDTDDIAKYVRTFITTYEKNQVSQKYASFYGLIQKKDYPGAFTQGKQLLSTEPNNISVMMNLVQAGYAAAVSGNTSLSGEASNYAKQVIGLIESGKTPEGEKPWYPFNNRDEALAYLNYYYAAMNLKAAPADAAGYLVKVVSFETPLKKDPLIYYQLAYAYEAGEYKRLGDAYQAFVGKEETPESKAARANLDQGADRIIDALARAIAYADADPKNKQKYAQQRAQWMTALTQLYKSRNNDSDANLPQYIASVTTRPMPQFKPVTAESMTPATPASGTTATPAATPTTPPATTTTTRPAATTTSTPGAATTTPARTTATPAARPAPTTPPSTTRRP